MLFLTLAEYQPERQAVSLSPFLRVWSAVKLLHHLNADKIRQIIDVLLRVLGDSVQDFVLN
jgi:hypothetical protein